MKNYDMVLSTGEKFVSPSCSRFYHLYQRLHNTQLHEAAPLPIKSYIGEISNVSIYRIEKKHIFSNNDKNIGH